MSEPYWKTSKAADNTLKMFYSRTMDDEITVDYIFDVCGRDLRQKSKNAAWLSNKLSTLRLHDYIKTNYSVGDRKRVSSIVLTDKGRQALGRATTIHVADEKRDVTPESVLNDIKVLRQQNPSFDIIFEMKPKETLRDKMNTFTSGF
jgi:hypothetical protein